jgi:LmbE family N-acetylglucosaminyl deacetylase
MQAMASAGVDVVVVAVTDGEASHPRARASGRDLALVRTDESRRALERLGCGSARVDRLHIADGRVGEHAALVTDFLVHHLGPDDLCLVPWRSDGHPDHDATSLAAAAAAHVAGAPILEYLVWAWHWAGPQSAEVPWSRCRRLNLSRRQAARKRWASYAFRSQIRPMGSDHDGKPLLSDRVLRRFWRPFEVYIEAKA